MAENLVSLNPRSRYAIYFSRIKRLRFRSLEMYCLRYQKQRYVSLDGNKITLIPRSVKSLRADILSLL